MNNLNMKDGEDFDVYWDRFNAMMVEVDKTEYKNHFKFLMGHFFIEGAWNVTPEEVLRLKDSMEDAAKNPKSDETVVAALKKAFIALKIENHRCDPKKVPIDTHYQDQRSCYAAWKKFEKRPDFANWKRSDSQKGFYWTQSGQYRMASCPLGYDRNRSYGRSQSYRWGQSRGQSGDQNRSYDRTKSSEDQRISDRPQIPQVPAKRMGQMEEKFEALKATVEKENKDM
jgi:hypothetical protein